MGSPMEMDMGSSDSEVALGDLSDRLLQEPEQRRICKRLEVGHAP